jgi:hypothetical protein
MIAQPMGQLWLWCSMAERITAEDPYFANFWTQPGHVGFDQPELVQHDLVDLHTTVKRALSASEILSDEKFAVPELDGLRAMAGIFGAMQTDKDAPMVIQLEDVPTGYMLGAGVRITSGAAVGRQLYCMGGAGAVVLADGEGEASNLKFSGVEPGDSVHIDNHAFLAFCYYARHHIRPSAEYDFLRLGATALYPQYHEPEVSAFMGTQHTGAFEGKMLWVHHTHDASLWPAQGLGMRRNILRESGEAALAERFRLRWTENAEHVPPYMAASPRDRANNTWLVEYLPAIEQSLADLAAWVEDGVDPGNTSFEFVDGQIVLAPTATERGGIQPVVEVTANGAARADGVRVGEEVTLVLHAAVPPGAGTIIAIKWDFDGTGTYPQAESVDGRREEVTLSTTHVFDRPGTYFPTALVESHRDGQVDATSRRIPNLAAARVVVV